MFPHHLGKSFQTVPLTDRHRDSPTKPSDAPAYSLLEWYRPSSLWRQNRHLHTAHDFHLLIGKRRRPQTILRLDNQFGTDGIGLKKHDAHDRKNKQKRQRF